MTSRIEKTIARQQEKYDYPLCPSQVDLTVPPSLNNVMRLIFYCELTIITYRIAAGAYYESHQQLRVIAARYIKQSNYDAAANILAGGAKALLRAGAQQGASASGGDLAIMLVVDVYNKAEWEVSDDEAGRQRKREVL